jgi:hypothetical protein
MVDNCAAGAKDGLILLGVKFTEFFREDILDVTAQKFLFIAATASLDERLIHSDIAALGVLDEKCRIGNVIKELLDNRKFGGDARRDFREGTGKSKNVGFHSGSHIT